MLALEKENENFLVQQGMSPLHGPLTMFKSVNDNGICRVSSGTSEAGVSVCHQYSRSHTGSTTGQSEQQDISVATTQVNSFFTVPTSPNKGISSSQCGFTQLQPSLLGYPYSPNVKTQLSPPPATTASATVNSGHQEALLEQYRPSYPPTHLSQQEQATGGNTGVVGDISHGYQVPVSHGAMFPGVEPPSKWCTHPAQVTMPSSSPSGSVTYVTQISKYIKPQEDGSPTLPPKTSINITLQSYVPAGSSCSMMQSPPHQHR